MARKPGLTAALRHRDFRLLMTAFTAASIGSWAYNIGLAVWIFDETGSAAWVGAATICRFVPALLFSAYAGVLADRFERVRLMVALNITAAAIMGLLAFETALDGPVAFAIFTAAVSSTIGTMYEPAVAALTPQLVGERDLGAANALRNTIDNIAVIAGPGLGVVLLWLGPPPVAIAMNALMYVVSAITVGRIRGRSKPVDVSEGGKLGPFRQMLVGAKAITSSSSAAALVAYSLLATMVFGFDTVQFVVLSRDVLGTAAEGYGYLLAGLGVGGVLAAPLVVRLEQLPRLGWVILVGMAVYCLPTLLFFIVSEPVAAFVIQVVRGAGTVVVDVLAITALQRSLPNELLARVFGAFNAFLLAAVVLGASLAPVIIHAWGLDASLWFAGAVIPLACIAGWPALRQLDQQALLRKATLAPRVSLLAGCDLFAEVSDGALIELAGASEEIAVASGDPVVSEGEKADAFYVVIDGMLGVTARGERTDAMTASNLGRGDYFGEIGLIEGIPRTATVTALQSARVLRVSGGDFLAALSESAPSPALLEGAALRLGRTHPTLRLTHAGLGSAE